MKKKMIAKLEILIDEIKDIANKTSYPFADDKDRLIYILDLIKVYEEENYG